MQKDKTVLVLPPVAPRRQNIAKRVITGLTVAGVALAAKASAADGADVSALTGAATTGASGVSTAVGAIALVAVGVGLLWWAASKLRPKA